MACRSRGPEKGDRGYAYQNHLPKSTAPLGTDGTLQILVELPKRKSTKLVYQEQPKLLTENSLPKAERVPRLAADSSKVDQFTGGLH